MRLAISVDYSIRYSEGSEKRALPGGTSPSVGSKNIVTVGSAKPHEHLRDIERALHSLTLEALEDLPQAGTLIGTGRAPWPNAPACCMTVTVNDIPERHDFSWPKAAQAVVPLVAAVAAASPFEGGRPNGMMSNNLCDHIRSSKEEKGAPLTTERRFSYGMVNEDKASNLSRSPIFLDENNRVLQVSLWDSQECARSNVAIAALLTSLLTIEDIGQDTDGNEGERLLIKAARSGTGMVKKELQEMLALAMESAMAEERMYLPLLRDRVERGCIGEGLVSLCASRGQGEVIHRMERCLRTNRPFLYDEGK